MFTGIVEEMGQVRRQEDLGDSVRLTVSTAVCNDVAGGDSIAVNGVCLTAVDVDGGAFTADVMRETLNRSSLGGLTAGDRVNLERAMRLDGRLGGHLVQGHVDATATVVERTESAHWEVLRMTMPAAHARYVVHKGSITIDGVSLTVADLDARSFSVSLVPATLRLTTLGHTKVGDRVNIEVDVIAKYVEKLLGLRAGPDETVPPIAAEERP